MSPGPTASAARRPFAALGRTVGTVMAGAALVLVSMLAGCSSDDGGGSSAAGTETAAGSTSTSAASSTTTAATAPSSTVVVEVPADGEDTTAPIDGDPEDPTTVAPDVDAPLPATAEALAAELASAEAAIRDEAVADEVAAAFGRRQQRLYRVLADNDDWIEPVLTGSPVADDPVIRRAVELNLLARTNLDGLVAAHGLETELPAWRVVAPRPAEELLGYYRDGEAQWGIEWPYLAAINLIETRMGRIEGISSAGAVGPMQFLPTTWAECCEGDATDPADAIPGAARYLTIRGGPEDMERAIWGYNNSDRYVAAVTAYADVLRDDPAAYRGYHAWQIYFRTTDGLVLLPVGYEEPEPVPVADWLAANPDRLVAIDTDG